MIPKEAEYVYVLCPNVGTGGVEPLKVEIIEYYDDGCVLFHLRPSTLSCGKHHSGFAKPHQVFKTIEEARKKADECTPDFQETVNKLKSVIEAGKSQSFSQFLKSIKGE